MLGWVITCHDELAQEMLDRLEQKFGPLAQCRAVNYWRNLSSNMLSRMMCDALHATDSGDVSAGGPMVSSLWHQQQKNPPFRLRHDAWGN